MAASSQKPESTTTGKCIHSARGCNHASSSVASPNPAIEDSAWGIVRGPNKYRRPGDKAKHLPRHVLPSRGCRNLLFQAPGGSTIRHPDCPPPGASPGYLADLSFLSLS